MEITIVRRTDSYAANARRAYAALAVGLVIVGVFTALSDTAANPWLYLVGGAYGTTLSVVGALGVPRARRHIWIAMAISQGLFLLGDVVWTLYANVLDVEPYPSAADVAYLAMYPVFALGMAWLVRGRRRGRDRAAFLDAAIVTTGATVIGVVFFVTPAASASGTDLLSRAVGAAYPAGDLLLLAVAIRLVTAGLVRNVSLLALLGSVVALLVADLWYVSTVVSDAPYPSWIDTNYLLAYLLLGFAAVHPAVDLLSESAPDRPDRITVARVSLLGLALVLVPAADLVAHLGGFPHDAWAVFVGGCVSALLVVLRMWGLVQDLQGKAVQLAALARKDGLTGVPNRRTWDHELSRGCAEARDAGTSLAVAVLDMDHFKDFNDTHGHLAGDLVLKETAAAWASIVHDRGVLARYGGEEFTVLLPEMSAEEVQGVLERMRRAVTHGQSCSIGVATWDGSETPADLMARADEALYRAKNAGRDRIAVHREGSVSVVTLPPEECPALASMRIVYQPIVDLGTGTVVAWEALSRFEGRSPAEVFASAAQDGTAPMLEAEAIERAISGFHGEGLLTLNVSLAALTSPRLQAALSADLTGVVLELTESDLVDGSPEVMLVLDDLRARGAQIAIDDFGVGFSNLHRVVTMHPEVVKIDMSLIRGIDADEGLQAALTACVLYAGLTSAKVVAEGVETEAERDCVARLGVELAQGYLLGTPGPPPAAGERAANL